MRRAWRGPARSCGSIAGFAPPAPLFAPAAALLLTLCDFETSVWLDPPLARQRRALREFLRFHTGARLVGVAGATPPSP